MPLLDYLGYSAGFVPREDAAAQQRCYNYLKETIAQMEAQISRNEASHNLANQKSVFEGARSVIEVAAGSVRLHRANNFWHYWDRNKTQIIKVREGTDDEYEIQDKVSELEEGRYVQE